MTQKLLNIHVDFDVKFTRYIFFYTRIHRGQHYKWTTVSQKLVHIKNVNTWYLGQGQILAQGQQFLHLTEIQLWRWSVCDIYNDSIEELIE